MSKYLLSAHYHKWQKKSTWQFLILAIIAVLLHIVLQLLGFKRLMSILHHLLRKKKLYQLSNKSEIRQLKKVVNPIFKKIRKSKYNWSNCFSTSILLWCILKKQGLETSIIIGTKKEKGIFKAHAWVEYDTFPLNENQKIREKYIVFEHNFSNKIIF
jgi:hypothetical protein